VNLLEDSEQHSYSVIEELRAYVSQRANCDDYGYRLHQLARPSFPDASLIPRSISHVRTSHQGKPAPFKNTPP
jgi:hypothetical protein